MYSWKNSHQWGNESSSGK